MKFRETKERHTSVWKHRASGTTTRNKKLSYEIVKTLKIQDKNIEMCKESNKSHMCNKSQQKHTPSKWKP